jgi:hypothetical protein
VPVDQFGQRLRVRPHVFLQQLPAGPPNCDLRGPRPECSGTDPEEIGMLAKITRAVPQDFLRNPRISHVESATAPREYSTVSAA